MPIEWRASKKIPSWLGQTFSILQIDLSRKPLEEGETTAMRLAKLQLIANVDQEGKKIGNPDVAECEDILEEANFSDFRSWRK